MDVGLRPLVSEADRAEAAGHRAGHAEERGRRARDEQESAGRAEPANRHSGHIGDGDSGGVAANQSEHRVTLDDRGPQLGPASGDQVQTGAGRVPRPDQGRCADSRLGPPGRAPARVQEQEEHHGDATAPAQLGGHVVSRGEGWRILRSPSQGGVKHHLPEETRDLPSRRDALGRRDRLLAACLAGIWLAAGLAGVAVGLWLRPGVLPAAAGLLAVGYGWIWSRVAITGRRRRWPPWKG